MLKVILYGWLQTLLFVTTGFLIPISLCVLYIWFDLWLLWGLFFLINIGLHFFAVFNLDDWVGLDDKTYSVPSTTYALLSFLNIMYMIFSLMAGYEYMRVVFLGKGIAKHMPLAEAYRQKDSYTFFQFDNALTIGEEMGYTFSSHTNTNTDQSYRYIYTERYFVNIASEDVPKYGIWMLHTDKWFTDEKRKDPRDASNYPANIHPSQQAFVNSLQDLNPDSSYFSCWDEDTSILPENLQSLVEKSVSPLDIMILQQVEDPHQQIENIKFEFHLLLIIPNALLVIIWIVVCWESFKEQKKLQG